MKKMLLAGDVGGTKANLALAEQEGQRLRTLQDCEVRTTDFANLVDLVRSFVGSDGPRIRSACFGVPGPVREGKAKGTNLPWSIDAEGARRALGIERLALVNDLLATARGIGELSDDRFAVLQPGRPEPRGAKVLIAAGTGLGEAFLMWDGRRHNPFPSEGGHADFAPRDALEVELFRHLAERFGHVSVERVVSGPGLHNVFQFLVETGQEVDSPRVRERMEREDPSHVISDEALAGTDHACAVALEIFVRVYGAEAGNLALKALATGGVYVGGGIAPKILPKLQKGPFLEAFRDKGRLSPLLAEMPVLVVLDPKAALYGAIRFAAEMQETAP
jgi:glucokinase